MIPSRDSTAGRFAGRQTRSICVISVLPAALVPNVVAQRDRVDAALQNRFRDRAGDARARGGVFAVGDNEVDSALRRAVCGIRSAMMSRPGRPTMSPIKSSLSIAPRCARESRAQPTSRSRVSLPIVASWYSDAVRQSPSHAIPRLASRSAAGFLLSGSFRQSIAMKKDYHLSRRVSQRPRSAAK